MGRPRQPPRSHPGSDMKAARRLRWLARRVRRACWRCCCWAPCRSWPGWRAKRGWKRSCWAWALAWTSTTAGCGCRAGGCAEARCVQEQLCREGFCSRRVNATSSIALNSAGRTWVRTLTPRPGGPGRPDRRGCVCSASRRWRNRGPTGWSRAGACGATCLRARTRWSRLSANVDSCATERAAPKSPGVGAGFAPSVRCAACPSPCRGGSP